jgi:hypothetical protein
MESSRFLWRLIDRRYRRPIQGSTLDLELAIQIYSTLAE